MLVGVLIKRVQSIGIIELTYQDLFGRFSEKLKLNEVLKKFIHPAESDPVIRQKLQMYTTRWPEVFVFMKVEKCSQSSIRYSFADFLQVN